MARATSLQTSQASAGEVSSSAGLVVVPGSFLSVMDGVVTPWRWWLQHTANGHEAAALRESLAFPFQTNELRTVSWPSDFVGGTNCDLLCHAGAPSLTQRLSETHKHTIMVQWLYLVVQSNPSLWALKLVKGEAHE